MTNMTPVLDNVLFHLQNPIAEKAFLHAADRWDASAPKYKAEQYAIEVKKLVSFTDDVPPKGFALQPCQSSSETTDDLQRYILKRHAVHFWGKEARMWFEH